MNQEEAHRNDKYRKISRRRAASPSLGVFANTCLTAVVSNQKLDAPSLRQLARQVHGSMSRAIEPFNTPVDGDALDAVTTNEVDGGDTNEFILATAASELAWDAVLASCGGR